MIVLSHLWLSFDNLLGQHWFNDFDILEAKSLAKINVSDEKDRW